MVVRICSLSYEALLLYVGDQVVAQVYAHQVLVELEIFQHSFQPQNNENPSSPTVNESRNGLDSQDLLLFFFVVNNFSSSKKCIKLSNFKFNDISAPNLSFSGLGQHIHKWLVFSLIV
jgi:hypothetical protein